MSAENPTPIVPTVVKYITKDDIEISHSVIKSLHKYSESAIDGHVEGVLFGHEDDVRIYIEQAFPLTKRGDDGIINPADYELIVRLI
jgi:hypothetical protein